MKVVIDIKEEDIDRLKKLAHNKKVSSISEFISIAIENQIEKEEELSIYPSLESLITENVDKPNNEIVVEKSRRIDTDIELVDQSKNIDAFPFWGTQNKYSCIKQIVVDFIDLSYQETEKWKRYDVSMNYLTHKAIETRRKFEAIDKMLHRPRGDKFSTGFPKNDYKSVARYERQFIGGIDSNQKTYGMAIELGFLSVRRNEENGKIEFGLTKEGLQLGKYKSPIFDKKVSDLTQSTPPLSNEEIEFIIKTLFQRKKSEIDLMKYTLQYIKDGKNHPEDGKELTKKYLDNKYPDIARNKKDGSFSILEANTIRAGTISRLTELGLLKIQKKGFTSEYKITDSGNEFLNYGRGN